MLWSREKSSHSNPGKFWKFLKKKKREPLNLLADEDDEPSLHPSIHVEELRESIISSNMIPVQAPPTHLRIKARDVHDRLLSPHRSPPSRPYTPTSTSSDTVSNARSSNIFASIDAEESEELPHHETENTSFSFEEKEFNEEELAEEELTEEELTEEVVEEELEEEDLHDPNPFASAPNPIRPNSYLIASTSQESLVPPLKNPSRSLVRKPTHDNFRESVVRDDSSSCYSFAAPAPASTLAVTATSTATGPANCTAIGATTSQDETWFSQRSSGWKRQRNRIHSVLPQQYRAKPLTLNGHADTEGLVKQNSIVIPERRRPVADEVVRRSSSKRSRRVSVASSLTSILPYIIRYNNTPMEAPSGPPQIDISGIQDTYTRVKVEHVEEADEIAEELKAQHRRINEFLSRRCTPPPVQPLHIRKATVGKLEAPCKQGVLDYAAKLDRDFEKVKGAPQPDEEFRERLFWGTSYAVRRRSRVLDKELPALPDHNDHPKRLNTFRSKFKIFV